MVDDFLTNYFHYAAGGNEVPEIYHKWAGIAALSMCAGRRFWIAMSPDYVIYPHLYVLLVGPAGGRKTSALTPAKRLLREVGTIPICATQITKEAMAKEMTQDDFTGRIQFKDPTTHRMIEYTEYAIFATEWVHFIKVNPEGMIDFLTTVWDEATYSASTKNMGKDLIMGPCLPILGCMTSEKTDAQIKSALIDGGFARRCCMVYDREEEEKYVAFPGKTPEQLASWERATNRARYISESTRLVGEFSWSKAAREWFEEWYPKQRRANKGAHGDLLAPYYRSRHDILLKLGMLLTVSQSNNTVLEVPALTEADELMKAYEIHLPKIFEGTGRNELATVANRILEYLRSNPNATRKRLQRDMFGQANAQEFGGVMEHLVQTDQIVEVREGGDMNKPARYLTKEDYEKRKES